jgi:hypothetical protein
MFENCVDDEYLKQVIQKRLHHLLKDDPILDTAGGKQEYDKNLIWMTDEIYKSLISHGAEELISSGLQGIGISALIKTKIMRDDMFKKILELGPESSPVQTAGGSRQKHRITKRKQSSKRKSSKKNKSKRSESRSRRISMRRRISIRRRRRRRRRRSRRRSIGGA